MVGGAQRKYLTSISHSFSAYQRLAVKVLLAVGKLFTISAISSTALGIRTAISPRPTCSAADRIPINPQSCRPGSRAHITLFDHHRGAHSLQSPPFTFLMVAAAAGKGTK